MAKNTKNKNVIIGIFVTIIIIAAIVAAIIFTIKNNTLDDSFFVSDGTKYVLTLDQSNTLSEEYPPIKAHLVYTYTGDTITGLKIYYEYNDEETAKAAQAYFTENSRQLYKSISVQGRFVILEADKNEYEGLTASDVKQQIEFTESLDNQNNSEEKSETEAESTPEPATTEETTVEVETVKE